MKEVFEYAFDNFVESMEEFKVFAVRFWYLILYVLFSVTAPFWAIPYAIIKKIREREHNGET